jgi:hypothetical protein
MRLPLGAKIGLVVGLIGAAVGLTAAIISDPIFGIFMSVIFIAVFGGTFGRIFGRMATQNRLLKTGVSARAVIKELRDTGVTVNNAPQVKLLLEVSPPTGAPYLVETKTLISRLETPSFQPGTELPVKIDPNNKNKIAIDRSGGASYAGGTGGIASGMSEQEAQAMLTKVNDENTRITAYGQSSKAIITNYKWLGVYVNGNNPFVELNMEVIPDSDKPFKASAKGVVKDTSVPKYQPGKEIWVKYDPEDHSKVAIDHS